MSPDLTMTGPSDADAPPPPRASDERAAQLAATANNEPQQPSCSYLTPSGGIQGSADTS